MSIFDTIIILTISGFAFYGFWHGFLRVVGNFLGLIIGVFISSRYYLEVFSYYEDFFGSYEGLGKILTFIIVFSIVSTLVGFAFSFVQKLFDILSIIPFLKTFNRLLGALLGVIVGSLFVGTILYVASKQFIIGSLIGDMILSSAIAPSLLVVAKILYPLFPEVLKQAKSLINI